MADNSDRTEHVRVATLDGDTVLVAYYHTQGRWYVETTGVEADVMAARSSIKPTRHPITLSHAVALALIAHKSEQGEWYTGVPGGRTLDARVRKALTTQKAAKR